MWHKISGITSKTGITYEISDDWTVVSVNKHGKRKTLESNECGQVGIAGKNYKVYKLAKLVGLPPRDWPDDGRDYHELDSVSKVLGIRYRAFRDGTIQRMDQNGNIKNMTHTITADGYVSVSIGGNILLHQLMGELFVPKPENMPADWTVHHVDKDPKNNHADNLEWASPRKQRIDQRPAEQHNITSCPVVGTATRDVILKNGDLVRKGEAVEFDNAYIAANMVADGYNSAISACLNDRKGRKSTAGFTWSVPPSDKEDLGEEFVSIGKNKKYERLLSQIGRIQYKFHNGYVKIILAASMMTDRKKEEKDTYPEINIDGKMKKIHRLVVDTFIGKVPEKIVIDGKSHRLVVDHIDDDKKNARIGNLQLLTHQENSWKCKNKGVARKTSVASFLEGRHEHHQTRESAIEYVKSRGFPEASLEELNIAIDRMAIENIVAKLYGRTWIRAHFTLV